MKRVQRHLVVSIACLAFAGATQALAIELWHNYQSGYNAASSLSSERFTLVNDSWTVDDAVLTSPGGIVRLQSIEWIGLRDPRYTYPQAEFILLRPVPDPQNPGHFLLQPSGVPNQLGTYTVEVLGSQGIYEIYRGTLALPNIDIPAGHYFVGTRLHGDPQVRLGRNFAVSRTGGPNPAGLDQGYFRSDDFGVPDWLIVERVPLVGRPTDYAFRLFGEQIPEPASFVLLAGGLAAMVARRWRSA